jgi:dTMP kinase
MGGAGRFVVIEGTDGCGKSLLAQNVLARLVAQGKKTRLVGFPSHDGEIGKLIRASFTGQVSFDMHCYMYLMIADHIDWEPRIAAWIEDGGVFLADRLTPFSAYAYQAEIHSQEALDAVYSTYPWRRPDHAFLVDVPVEVAMERQRTRPKYKDKVFEKEDVAYNERLRRRYVKMFDMYEGPKTILDGTKPPEELAETALAVLKL